MSLKEEISTVIKNLLAQSQKALIQPLKSGIKEHAREVIETFNSIVLRTQSPNRIISFEDVGNCGPCEVRNTSYGTIYTIKR